MAKRPSRAAGIGASIALGLTGIAVGALLTRDVTPQPEPSSVTAAPTPGNLQVVLTPQPAVAPLVIEPAPEIKPAVKAAPKSPAGDCARPGGRRCNYSAVLAADSSLRQAYRRAARAGVPGDELRVYRRSWDKLRRAGARDPDRVVRGYRGMAADLNRLARERRA